MPKDQRDIVGQLPSAGASEWAVTNRTTDRVLNADSTSTAELADVIGTLIEDLIAIGILKGSVS